MGRGTFVQGNGLTLVVDDEDKTEVESVEWDKVNDVLEDMTVVLPSSVLVVGKTSELVV